jgi:hypothetical protein
MANFNPLSSSVSFDDLLKANKQQFDRIFSAQTEELGVLGVSHRPPTDADLVSASLASAAEAPADIYAMLNTRFGSGWSSEVVEHKSERGSVTVLCKLTVNGSSKDAIRLGTGKRRRRCRIAPRNRNGVATLCKHVRRRGSRRGPS